MIAARLSVSASGSAAIASTRAPWRRQRASVSLRLPARWSWPRWCARRRRQCRAFGSEALGESCPDAAARAGDDDVAAPEARGHQASRSWIVAYPVEAGRAVPSPACSGPREPLDHGLCELPVLRHQREHLTRVGVIEKINHLPGGPLVAAGIAEPRAAGAADLVGLAVFAGDRCDWAPDPRSPALLVVDQRAHVRVRPLLEAFHLRPKAHSRICLRPRAANSHPRAVVPGVERVSA